MGHRVVRTFVYMLPIEGFGHDLVEYAVHIGPDVGVVVLVQGDGGTRVLNKQVEHADLYGGSTMAGTERKKKGAGIGRKSELPHCEVIPPGGVASPCSS